MTLSNNPLLGRNKAPYRSHGSAAYSASMSDVDRSTLAILCTGLLGIVLFWWAIPGFAYSGWSSMSMGLVAGYAIYRGHEKLIRWKILTSPPLMPERVGHPDWSWFRYSGWGGDRLPAYMLESERKSKDMALFLHGYGSCAGRIEQRMLHMHDLGFHILAPDLRGHGSAGLREEWTGLKMIADIELLLDSFEADAKRLGIKRIHIYGHSMGGFLGMRVASHQSGWWAERIESMMLESPVTSFPNIIGMLHPGLLASIVMPLSRRVIRHEYERIHPDLNVRWDEAQIPDWGVPDLPVLVMQAAADQKLGIGHLEKLVPHLPKESVVHVVTTLDHSSVSDSPERRELLEEYLSGRGLGER